MMTKGTLMSIYDIIIVGGGISGSMAAISAARCKAKVLLVEKDGYLGGMLTGGGVGPMMTFHAGDKQVIRGITGELIDRLISKGKSPGHIVDTTGYTYTVTPFEAEAMKTELESMLIDVGGEILYHTMLADVSIVDSKIESITICNKAGLNNIKAKCYIDATGDGDLSSWAGVPTHKGRLEDGVCQPMTLNIKMYNVDIPAINEYMKSQPEQFGKSIPLLDISPRLSIGGFKDIVQREKAKGGLKLNTKGSVLLFETDKRGEVIINSTRVIGADSTSPKSLSDAETKARKEAAELVEFLKNSFPGFENAQLSYTGPNIGIRSSRQIVGLYTFTQEDLLSCKVFDDPIAHSGYPIDIHNPSGAGGKSIHIEKGKYYSIPYRTMINEKIDNLITVGRCISATFEAQAAIRLSPTAGAIGHAGGAAAHLYVSKNLMKASQVDYGELKEILLGQNAFL